MTNSDFPRIAIIGGGFSGAMVAVHLLRHAVSPLTIYLIERKPTIGPGVAYSTASECHLLNVPAGKMSAFPDEPDHFLNWLQSLPEQQDLWNFDASSFVTRRLYGQYIQVVLNDAATQARSGVQLEQIIDEAVAIQPQVNQASVVLKGGRTLEVDRVVVAWGNFVPKHPHLGNSATYESWRYHASPWSIPNFTAFAADETVMVVGSGLTAIDVVARLHQQGHQGQIILVSRRGLLPQPHRPGSAYPAFTTEQLPQRLSALMRHIRQEIEFAALQGYDWRSVLDALRPVSQLLWQNLTLAEQRRFLRHLRPYWETHRHRIAPPIAQIIVTLQQTGQLQVHAGRIQSCQEDEAGINVMIQQRCSKLPIHLHIQHIINCTGSELNYDRLQHPLITHLFQIGLIQTDSLKLGLATAENGALIDAKGNASSWLYTLGCLRKGQLWETTAVPEIRQQAQTLAKLLLMQITSPRSQFNHTQETATTPIWQTLIPVSTQ